MQEFLGWLLRAQGVTTDPGTELRFELASFPDGGRALLVWLAACVLVAAVVVIHRREGKGRSDLTPRRRRALTVLRATTLLFVGMLWFEPRVVAVRRDVRPGHVLLLVDASQSMTQLVAFRGLQGIAGGILTANAFAEDRKACLEAGMDDHLVKPLELDALRIALARWTKTADRAKVAAA